METIFNRRSIRKFTDQKVSEEQLQKIIQAGMAAPSAGNEQPWHFILLDERKVLDRIPEVHPYSRMLLEVNTAIVVCADLKLQKYDGFWVQDCAAATQNMLLMAEALGLGSVWLGVYPVEERVKALQGLLELPDHVVPLSVLPIGYPAEKRPPNRPDSNARLHRNQWQRD